MNVNFWTKLLPPRNHFEVEYEKTASMRETIAGLRNDVAKYPHGEMPFSVGWWSYEGTISITEAPDAYIVVMRPKRRMGLAFMAKPREQQPEPETRRSKAKHTSGSQKPSGS